MPHNYNSPLACFARVLRGGSGCGGNSNHNSLNDSNSSNLKPSQDGMCIIKRASQHGLKYLGAEERADGGLSLVFDDQRTHSTVVFRDGKISNNTIKNHIIDQRAKFKKGGKLAGNEPLDKPLSNYIDGWSKILETVSDNGLRIVGDSMTNSNHVKAVDSDGMPHFFDKSTGENVDHKYD